MGRKNKVTAEERIQILQYIQEGKTNNKIMELTGRSRTTVSRIRGNKLQTLKKKNKKKTGRRWSVSDREVRAAVREMKSCNEKGSVFSLQRFINSRNLTITRQSLGRALKKKSIGPKKLKKKPVLSALHRQKRLNFVKEHFNKTDWTKVLFSDEKKWKLDRPDGNYYQWMFLDPEDPNYTKQYNLMRRQQGGKGVMMWGCMATSGLGSFCFTSTTMDSKSYKKIIKDFVLPIFKEINPELTTFQQDNSPIHVSGETSKFLQTCKFQVLKWPPCSPDLNPMENLWKILQDRVYSGNKGFSSIKQLMDKIEEEWDKITPQECVHLIGSMQRRLEEVIDNAGGHNKY